MDDYNHDNTMVKEEKDPQIEVNSSFLADVETGKDFESVQLVMDEVYMENSHCDDINKIKTEAQIIQNESSNDLDLCGNDNDTVGQDITQNESSHFSEVQPTLTGNDTAVEMGMKYRFMCQLCQKVFTKCYNGYRHARRVHKKCAEDAKKFVSPVLQMFTLDAENTSTLQYRDIVKLEETHAHKETDMIGNVQQVAIDGVENNETFSETSNISGFMYEEKQSSEGNSHLTKKRDDFTTNNQLKACLTKIDVHKYVCQLCEATFDLSSHAYRHVKAVHKMEDITNLIRVDRTIKVDTHDCGHKGHRKEEMKHLKQIKRHRKEEMKHLKWLKCKLCDNSYSMRKSLDEHVKRVHSGQCNICGKLFKNKNDANKHKLYVHSSGRNYVCAICGHKSKKKTDLNVHMRQHTGEKPYKCDICHKAFMQHPHLKQHMLQHTGEKNYKCNVCGWCFSRVDVLRTHMKTHKDGKINIVKRSPRTQSEITSTSEAVSVCHLCKKVYGRASTAYKHVRVVHKRKTDVENLVTIVRMKDIKNKNENQAELEDLPNMNKSTEVSVAKRSCLRKRGILDVVHGENENDDDDDNDDDYDDDQRQLVQTQTDVESVKIQTSHKDEIISIIHKAANSIKNNVKVYLTRIDGTVHIYVCRLCDATFSFAAQVYAHMRNAHRKGQIESRKLIRLQRRGICNDYAKESKNSSAESKVGNINTSPTKIDEKKQGSSDSNIGHTNEKKRIWKDDGGEDKECSSESKVGQTNCTKTAGDYICELCEMSFVKIHSVYQHLRTYHKRKIGLAKLVRMGKLMQKNDKRKLKDTYKKLDIDVSKQVSKDQTSILNVPKRTGQEMVICPLCGRLFISNGCVISHLINVHSVKPDFIECALSIPVQSEDNRNDESHKTTEKHEMGESDEAQVLPVGDEEENVEEYIDNSDNIWELRVEDDIDESNEEWELPVTNDSRQKNASIDILTTHGSDETFKDPSVTKETVRNNKSMDTLKDVNGVVINEAYSPLMKSQTGENDKVVDTQTRKENSNNCHSSEKFRCGHCKEYFQDDLCLRKHECTCSGLLHPNTDTNCVCKQCGKIFHKKRTLRYHMQKMHRHVPLKCDCCDRSFLNIQTKTKHMDKEHVAVKCEKCNMILKGKTQFVIHKKRYCYLDNTNQSRLCALCGLVLCDHQALIKHSKFVHGDIEVLHKELQCKQCNKVFKHKRDLSRHVKVIHLGIRHLCDVCGKAFRDMADLKNHKAYVHFGERKHVCDICGHASIKSTDLKIHRRQHTRERPFQCHECGNRFMQAPHLKTHMLMHSQQKPFECSECGHAFNRSDVLKQHMRTHTGEKPYICDVCGKGFAQSCAMNTHKKTHKNSPSQKIGQSLVI